MGEAGLWLMHLGVCSSNLGTFLPSQVSPPACACQEIADKAVLIAVGQAQCVLLALEARGLEY